MKQQHRFSLDVLLANLPGHLHCKECPFYHLQKLISFEWEKKCPVSTLILSGWHPCKKGGCLCPRIPLETISRCTQLLKAKTWGLFPPSCTWVTCSQSLSPADSPPYVPLQPVHAYQPQSLTRIQALDLNDGYMGSTVPLGSCPSICPQLLSRQLPLKSHLVLPPQG